jgi:chromosome segregation ATPase
MKNLIILALIVLSFSSCVTSRDYQQLKQQNQALGELVGRLRSMNEELTSDKFTTVSFSHSKIAKLSEAEEKQKNDLILLQQRYAQLQREVNQLSVEVQKKNNENLALRLQIDSTQNIKLKEMEELQGKLQWVYTKYKVKR